MHNYFKEEREHLVEFAEEKGVKFFIPRLKKSKIFNINNIEELNIAEKKCLVRLEQMAMENPPFLPITWEEELLLEYSMLKERYAIGQGKAVMFMGVLLKKTVFTYNPYEN